MESSPRRWCATDAAWSGLLAHGVNVEDAVARIKERRVAARNVLESAPPDVEILEFDAAGTRLVVRPCAHDDHDWQVYFDTNKALLEVGTRAGGPMPSQHRIEERPVP